MLRSAAICSMSDIEAVYLSVRLCVSRVQTDCMNLPWAGESKADKARTGIMLLLLLGFQLSCAHVNVHSLRVYACV
jgi:hypothetical protein